jgi:hypothetical protein
LIDIYLLTIGRLKSLDSRTLDVDAGDGRGGDVQRITQYLSRLDAQRTTPLAERDWSAFDELSEVAVNFALILDVNVPEARSKEFREVTRLFGTLLGQQQPVGGMFGQVSRKVVQQFRMPGYPFVLVTTDLLQEGEDLHTFCSAIQHYGISWTPSSMEQRIGRIDRLRSQTDRRLNSLDRDATGEDLLQVYFPYLQDTVEILQVERVLERMNVFLKLMHEGLVTESVEDKHIDVREALARGRRQVERITGTLKTAFPICSDLLAGDVKALAVSPEAAAGAATRFADLQHGLTVCLRVDWSPMDVQGRLMGTMKLPDGRIQPFTLLVDSLDGRLIVRCVSPVGDVQLDSMREAIEDSVSRNRVRLGAIPGLEPGSYNLTVQEDVLLGRPEYDVTRVAAILVRVAKYADQMEMTHLPGYDRPLESFAHDLRREGVFELD